MIKRAEILEIKKWLPYGFTKKIAERSGYSESSVEKFFSGKIYNADIHEAAIVEAKENKIKIESLKALSKKL